MDFSKLLGYEGKNVVVTGAASGMGLETAKLLIDLEANVYALDVKDVPGWLRVEKYVRTDLSRKGSVDAAIDQLPRTVDKIFCFAGVIALKCRIGEYTIPEFVSIHFTGHRHLVENLLPRMSEGGAIVWMASDGAIFWQKRLCKLLEFVKTPSYEAANEWIEKHLEDPEIGHMIKEFTYHFAKEAVIAYVKWKAWELSARRIRINTLSPTATETSMLREITVLNPYALKTILQRPVGRCAHPIEIAWPAVFLNSDLASYISGEDLAVQYGLRAAIETKVCQTPRHFPP